MQLLLASLLILLLTGFVSWGVNRGTWADRVGPWGNIAGCALGLIPAVRALLGGPVESLHAAWAVPGGSFSVELDALSALFLVPMLVLSAVGALYGSEYMATGHNPRPRSHWFFYSLLTAAMALVVLARNGMLFLLAWEVMALASFFLVTTDDEQENVRDAGWVYLVATHLGTAFLFGFFALLGNHAGSMDFDRLLTAPSQSPGVAAAAFALAIVGFGAKAGFVPFHVWLPEAHPAAPSHVSALMSGVMIKTGVYGLLRALTLLGPPPSWWGWTLVTVGLVCAIGGVLFVLAQSDLKRLLAYSSVENIGIITLGIGLGVLGQAKGLPGVTALGYAGALLHVLNHAAFKGLLFLSAGSVLHAAGTAQLDRLGGLIKRMPQTGAAFLVGSVAIAGLPPLNGFVGEYLLFLAGFRGAMAPEVGVVVPAAGCLAGLALVSGLAAAGFTRAFGIAFLGEPRDAGVHGHDPGWAMKLPMAVLAALCVLLGFGAPFVLPAVVPAVAVLAGTSSAGLLASDVQGLRGVAATFTVLLAAVALLALLRNRLLAGRTVGHAPTWDCGYAAPTARMQYTASSFAQPLTSLFQLVLRTRRSVPAPEGLFPEAAAFATETPDICNEGLYRPLFGRVGQGLLALRRLQHGQLHLYVLYIALTLLILLIWKLG